jgi:hypothetical protein
MHCVQSRAIRTLEPSNRFGSIRNWRLTPIPVHQPNPTAGETNERGLAASEFDKGHRTQERLAASASG